MSSNNPSEKESNWQWGHTIVLLVIVVHYSFLIWWLLSPVPTLAG